MAKKEYDPIFGAPVDVAPSYFDAPWGLKSIDMPTNTTHDIGRGPSPMRTTGEYPDMPSSREVPDLNTSSKFRKLKHQTGLPTPSGWSADDAEPTAGKFVDRTDPRYK
jgi:hypothetical protein